MAALAQDEFESTALSAPAAATCCSARATGAPVTAGHGPGRSSTTLAAPSRTCSPFRRGRAVLGKSAGADDGVRNRDSEEGVAVLPHLGQRRKLTSRELRRVCPVTFGLLQQTSLAKGIEPHHHQMQRGVFPMPEKGQHESGGSERSRIHRCGRGSVVFFKKEHAQFHICKRLQGTSHQRAGSSMTDLTGWAAASWRCCGTLGDHYHMQMLSSTEGSRLCVENLSRSDAGHGNPRSPPHCVSIDVASFSLLHCATRLGFGG